MKYSSQQLTIADVGEAIDAVLLSLDEPMRGIASDVYRLMYQALDTQILKKEIELLKDMKQMRDNIAALGSEEGI